MIISGERTKYKSNFLWPIPTLRECWSRSRKTILWQKKLDQIERERQCKNSSIIKRLTTNQQIPDHLNSSQSKVHLETSVGVIESDQMHTRRDTLLGEDKAHFKSNQMGTSTSTWSIIPWPLKVTTRSNSVSKIMDLKTRKIEWKISKWIQTRVQAAMLILVALRDLPQ